MAKAKAKAKPKSKAKPKVATPGDAAAELARAVGKPDNINTVAIDQLACVKRWAALDGPSRVGIVDQLATALDKLRREPVFLEIKSCAWAAEPAFTTMVSLGKAIDRLIRARLPLTDAQFCMLATIVVERADFSALRLTTQLEQHATISPALDLAIGGMIQQFSWNKQLTSRLWALVEPVADRSIARKDPVEARLVAEAKDPASLEVYADYLDGHADHRCAAFIRFLALPKAQRFADQYHRLAILVDPKWRARVGGDLD